MGRSKERVGERNVSFSMKNVNKCKDRHCKNGSLV